MREAIFKFCAGACFAMLTAVLFANAGSSWQTHVPENERSRPNPFAADPEAVQAGAKMFQRHCASCHGKNAEGKGKKPSLRSGRVAEATPGEIQWLLRNGSLVAGMPSWSRLPEEQRWQIVTYVKSLQKEASPSPK